MFLFYINLTWCSVHAMLSSCSFIGLFWNKEIDETDFCWLVFSWARSTIVKLIKIVTIGAIKILRFKPIFEKMTYRWGNVLIFVAFETPFLWDYWMVKVGWTMLVAILINYPFVLENISWNLVRTSFGKIIGQLRN
jgi:hypothetical protein